MDDSGRFYTVRGYQLLEQSKKLLTSAMEDYLEMIYRNSLEEGYLRINTLAELLHVQAPSATRMVQRLSALKLINYKKYGVIFMTPNGVEIGKFLLQRHCIIESFLKHLGVQESLLTETELIEHNVTANTLNRILIFNKFFEQNPEIADKFANFSSIYTGY